MRYDPKVRPPQETPAFDAFAVRADKDIRKALAALQPFSDVYQGSWDNPVPAFRRHQRPAPAATGKA